MFQVFLYLPLSLINEGENSYKHQIILLITHMSSPPKELHSPIRLKKVTLRHKYCLESGIKALLFENVLADAENVEFFINGIDLISETKDPFIVVAISTSPTLLPLSAVPFDVRSGKRQVVNFSHMNSKNPHNLDQDDDENFDIFSGNGNSKNKNNNSSNKNLLYFYKQFSAVIEISCHIKDTPRFASFASVEHKPEHSPSALRFSLNSLTYFGDEQNGNEETTKIDKENAASDSNSHRQLLRPSLFAASEGGSSDNNYNNNSHIKNCIIKISEDSKKEAIRNQYLRLFSSGICIVQMKIHRRAQQQQQQHHQFETSPILDGALIAHCIPVIHSVVVAAGTGFSSGVAGANATDSQLRTSFDRFQPGDYPVSVCAIPSCAGFVSESSDQFFLYQRQQKQQAKFNTSIGNSTYFSAASAFIAVGTSRSGIFIFNIHAIAEETQQQQQQQAEAAVSKVVSLEMAPIRVLSSCDPPSSNPFFNVQVATSASHLAAISPFSDVTRADLLKSRVGTLIAESTLAFPLSWSRNELQQPQQQQQQQQPLPVTLAPASLPPSPMITILGTSWRSIAKSSAWNIGGVLTCSNIPGAAATSAARIYGGASCHGFGILVVEKEKWGFLNSEGRIDNVIPMTSNDDDDENDDDDDDEEDEQEDEEKTDRRYGRFSQAATAPLVFSDATFGPAPGNGNNNNKVPLPTSHHLLGSWIVTEKEKQGKLCIGLVVCVHPTKKSASRNVYGELKCSLSMNEIDDSAALPLRRQRLETEETDKSTNNAKKPGGKKSRSKIVKKKQDGDEDEKESEKKNEDNPLEEICKDSSHVLKVRVSHAFKIIPQATEATNNNNNNNINNNLIESCSKPLDFFSRISLLRYDGAVPSDLNALKIFSLEAAGFFDNSSKKKGFTHKHPKKPKPSKKPSGKKLGKPRKAKVESDSEGATDDEEEESSDDDDDDSSNTSDEEYVGSETDAASETAENKELVHNKDGDEPPQKNKKLTKKEQRQEQEKKKKPRIQTQKDIKVQQDAASSSPSETPQAETTVPVAGADQQKPTCSPSPSASSVPSTAATKSVAPPPPKSPVAATPTKKMVQPKLSFGGAAPFSSANSSRSVSKK